jgi:hypothetical protein
MLPRFGTGSPIAAEWDRHPEYLALANGLWHTGLSNAPR